MNTNTKPKWLTLGLVAILALISIAGVKVSRMTRTRDIQTNSLFLVSTQDSSGRWYSRHIPANDLATNLFFDTSFSSLNGWLWLTNGRVIIVSNGLTGQFLTYSNGVPQWVDVAPGGGGGSVETQWFPDQSQFFTNASGVFAIKSAASVTNPTVYGATLKSNILHDGAVGTVVSFLNSSNYFGSWTRFAGMSPGTGKVLTSQDGDGNAIWQDPAVTTALLNAASNALVAILVANDTTTSNGVVAFELTRNAAVSNALVALLVANDTITSNGAVSFTMTASNVVRNAAIANNAGLGTNTTIFQLTLKSNILHDGAFGETVSFLNTSNYFGSWTRFAGMVPGTGKVLTSQDADGNAIWQVPAVTNANNLSLSNATMKPVFRSRVNSMLDMFGLEQGANITLTMNGSNIVIASSGGGGIAAKTNDTAASTQSTVNLTNNTDILWIVSDVGASSRMDIEARIQNDAIEFAQMQNISSDRLLGRDTAGSGDVEEISLDGTTLEFSGSASIRRGALSGDITASAGSATTDLANNAVEDSELRDSSGVSLIGRAANSTGDPADILLLNNGEWLWRSNNAVISGKGVLTNTMFMNVNFLSAAGGSVVQFHDNNGILTNRPITLTDSDSVTGVLPLANSTTNFNVLDSGAIQAGVSIITNWQRLIGYSHFLRTTNLWADGGAGSLYSNTLVSISGGVSNLLWTNIQDGQDVVSWLYVSNGVSVGFPQFVAADFPDGAVITPNTNCWTKIVVSRRNTTTNIQVFTAGFELATGPGITFSTNYATRVITALPSAVTTNLIGTVANNVTNENSTALQINTGTLTLSPGVISNLNASTIDVPAGNIVSNVVQVKYQIQQPPITASNLLVSFNTNNYECVGLTNIQVTNIVEETTGVNAKAKIVVRNTLSVSVPIMWPAFGAQHGYYFHTNGLNDTLSATVAPPGTNTVIGLEIDGTNVYPSVTYWRHP